MSKPACAAGVAEGTFPYWGPCWNANAPKTGETCAQYCEPTDEQLAARELEIDASIHRLGMCMKAITDHEKSGRLVIGTEIRIHCPCCCTDEALTFYRTQRRLYVKCVTPQCMAFEANTGGARY